jgi:hypothetical protein
MRQGRAALLLMTVQVLLVLSIGGKYLYERKVCPRIWVRATRLDPNLALRGRYLALQLLVNTCSLPRDKAHYTPGYKYADASIQPGYWKWNVTLVLENGHLAPRLEGRPGNQNDIHHVWLRADKPCDRVPLQPSEDYFIPDQVKDPFPLESGQELWVEVTIPPSGPPRPIQLALSNGTRFQSLSFE